MFQSRWALSYLAGPLTREQIRKLAPGVNEASHASAASCSERTGDRGRRDAVASAAAAGAAATTRPTAPAGISERFLPVEKVPTASEQLLYRPALLGVASLHYALAKAGVDCWEKAAWLAPLDAASAAAPWEGAREIGRAAPDLDAEPAADARFAELPAAAMRAESYERWRKALAAQLYRTRALVLLVSADPAQTSRPGESEGAFRVRLRDALRESRDAAVEKLRARFAPQLATLRDQKARAEHRIEAEREQYAAKKMDSVISLGASVVGALFGRKLASRAQRGPRRDGDARDRSRSGRARRRRSRRGSRRADRAPSSRSWSRAVSRRSRHWRRAASKPSRSRNSASRRARPTSKSIRSCWSGHRGASRRTAARSPRGRSRTRRRPTQQGPFEAELLWIVAARRALRRGTVAQWPQRRRARGPVSAGPLSIRRGATRCRPASASCACCPARALRRPR